MTLLRQKDAVYSATLTSCLKQRPINSKRFGNVENFNDFETAREKMNEVLSILETLQKTQQDLIER